MTPHDPKAQINPLILIPFSALFHHFAGKTPEPDPRTGVPPSGYPIFSPYPYPANGATVPSSLVSNLFQKSLCLVCFSREDASFFPCFIICNVYYMAQFRSQEIYAAQSLVMCYSYKETWGPLSLCLWSLTQSLSYHKEKVKCWIGMSKDSNALKKLQLPKKEIHTLHLMSWSLGFTQYTPMDAARERKIVSRRCRDSDISNWIV